jgi:hypothetical protein
MSKNQRGNKESKKKSALTPKERKTARREMDQAGGHVPFIVKDA